MFFEGELTIIKSKYECQLLQLKREREPQEIRKVVDQKSKFLRLSQESNGK